MVSQPIASMIGKNKTFLDNYLASTLNEKLKNFDHLSLMKILTTLSRLSISIKCGSERSA